MLATWLGFLVDGYFGFSYLFEVAVVSCLSGAVFGHFYTRDWSSMRLVADEERVQIFVGDKVKYDREWSCEWWRPLGFVAPFYRPMTRTGQFYRNIFVGGSDLLRLEEAYKSQQPPFFWNLRPQFQRRLILFFVALVPAVCSFFVLTDAINGEDFVRAKLVSIPFLFAALAVIYYGYGVVAFGLAVREETVSKPRLRFSPQTRFLEKGRRFVYDIPAECSPKTRASEKYLCDSILIEQDGSLLVTRGKNSFRCEYPIGINIESQSSCFLASFEVWKQGKYQTYRVDRRYLVEA